MTDSDFDVEDFLKEELTFWGDYDMTQQNYREAFRKLVKLLVDKEILDEDDVRSLK
ncbi:MAG: hypothetical protein JNL11_10805 [Bdellovibrionaceae bacterium]|nr:hypothetical protein [Pseudobdellovibrionaceae bacterium]